MWDWRYPIDDLRKEVREARSAGRTTTSLDNLEAKLDELESMFGRLENEDLETRKDTDENIYRSQIEHWERYLSYSFDKASEYNRVIMAGAFVAYFAIWLRVYESADKSLANWSVAFVLVSLIVFVAWEIFRNLYMSRSLRDEAALFKKSGKEYIEAKKKADGDKRRLKIWITPLWYVVLVTTISTGALGSALLLLCLVFLAI